MQNWQPTASLENLKLRAKILAKIRTFFSERGVLEVETPTLSHATVTDVHLQSFVTHYQSDGAGTSTPLYLQTSPEYAMKRLLAAGSGPIFQICKSFRNDGENGRFHNPEFSMLEWYRPGFTHHELMTETDELLQHILQSVPAERSTYADIFWRYADINPHTASLEELKNRALQLEGVEKDFNFTDRDSWLQLLMMHLIEPKLGCTTPPPSCPSPTRGEGTPNKILQPTIVYDFPASQAALARIRADNPPVAERFEVYIEGIELANGFHELTDAKEQEQRFKKDLQLREKLGYSLPPIDYRLLAALEHGMPPCAGIALGIDRLVMLATKASKLADILSFAFDGA